MPDVDVAVVVVVVVGVEVVDVEVVGVEVVGVGVLGVEVVATAFFFPFAFGGGALPSGLACPSSVWEIKVSAAF